MSIGGKEMIVNLFSLIFYWNICFCKKCILVILTPTLLPDRHHIPPICSYPRSSQIVAIPLPPVHTHTPPRSSLYPTHLITPTLLQDHHHTRPPVHLYVLEYIHNCLFAVLVLYVAIVYFSRSSVIWVVRFWRKCIVLAIHFCVLWLVVRNLEFWWFSWGLFVSLLVWCSVSWLLSAT